ncbi:beta-lactamase family protein [Pacificimonas sp. WHA3]|uniref:Beta-lactamase family protein n=1 Tax=Pacificimonas pallii TaxID=2827236 RepID=A0ABS6SDC5_9SPHN|nr:serine hydrolase [Pacificimonas pallii]MBV7256419.1 beta-lactamase family protein [Pacificimonas pallii]
MQLNHHAVRLISLACLWLFLSAMQGLPAAITDRTGTATNSGTIPSADTVDMAELESFVDGFIAAKLVDLDPPGMAVAIVVGDRQITKGYGLADVSAGRLNDEQTLFRIGSISKLFVWMSLHMLADDGKIDLDAEVNSFFDGFAIPDAFDRQVTVRDLMAHRPGFEDNLRDFLDPDRDVSLREAVSREIPRRVAPAGEFASYSNTGTNMAAYIVERVSGMPYNDFVRTRILQPAGMTSTTLSDPGTGRNPDALDARMAAAHKIEDGLAVTADYMAVRPQEPVGAVAMDARDAATFMRLLLNETRVEGGRLLSPEAFARLGAHAFPDGEGGDDMGWGFMLNDVDGLSTFGHGGATQFLSWLFIVPELDLGVFASANMNSANSYPVDFAWAVARKVAGTDAASAFYRRKGDVDAANEVAGTYLNNRRPQGSGAAIAGMATDMNVRATDDGYLVVPGRSETRYAPLAKDIWVNISGARLRVVRGEDGRIVRLHGGMGTATLERISFLSSTPALALGFGGAMLLSLTTLLGMWYRRGRMTRTTVTGRKLKWIAAMSALLWLAFGICLALVALAVAELDISKVDETGFPPLSLKAAFFMTVVLAIQTGIHVIGIVPAWTKSGWTAWRRIHFTVFGLVAAFAIGLMIRWNILGGSFYGL